MTMRDLDRSRRYAREGPVGLISRHRSRPSNNRLDRRFRGACDRQRFSNPELAVPVSTNWCRSMAATIVGSKTGRHRARRWYTSTTQPVDRVNQKSATGGDGHTQFGRALYELNIDGICANTPAAKGRVESAHQTLQDRLVKELRLHGISTIEAANAFMPTFIADYNGRFGKYVEVFQFPDGRIEIRAGGMVLPYSIYDKLGEIDQGAVVENKRLGLVLRIAQLVQVDREIGGAGGPSTAHRPDGKHVPDRVSRERRRSANWGRRTCVERSRRQRSANTRERERVPGGHF